MALINKTISKDQAIYTNIIGGDGTDFVFESWPNNYKFPTLNYLFSPEFIINNEPYCLHIVYELGEAMLELKAIKLYLATFKDKVNATTGDILEELYEKITELVKPKSLGLILTKKKYNIIKAKDEHKVIDSIISDQEHINSFIEENISFDTKKEEVNSEILDESYFNKKCSHLENIIVNKSSQIPVIIDQLYIFHNDIDVTQTDEMLSEIEKTLNETTETDTDKYLVLVKDIVQKYISDFELFALFNIRGNVKKYKVLRPKISKSIESSVKSYVTTQVMKKFGSYTY